MGKKEFREPAAGSAVEQKKMTSIARQVHFQMIRKRIGLFFFLDILMVGAAAFAYIAGLERMRFGEYIYSYSRGLTLEKGVFGLFYEVADASGKVLIHVDMIPFLRTAGILAAVLFGAELLLILFGYAREDRKIRKILNPIYEIALRADELSRFAFTEDKYQMLEVTIDGIDPDSTEERKLSFGDKDLAGVEAAINNLLKRMRETYRQQARFVNDASHELRTPIAVIQGYANMLRRWGKEDGKILDESILAISNESEHMNHLVEQLLFLARGDSGKTVLKRVDTNLTEMMREVYEESFMIDETHPYRFRPSGEEQRGFVDEGLIKQAVRILIDNAAKYTKEGDEIYLGCGREGDDTVYLEVQDTGIGMAEADAEHMFERFYRSDEVRSYQGTGLGLSIAKWIVDKHGGHFEILTRTGLGTRIRIVLPSFDIPGNSG